MLERDDELSPELKRGVTIGMMAALNYVKRLHYCNTEIRGSEMMFFLAHEIQRMLPTLESNSRAKAAVNADIESLLSTCRCNLQ